MFSEIIGCFGSHNIRQLLSCDPIEVDQAPTCVPGALVDLLEIHLKALSALL